MRPVRRRNAKRTHIVARSIYIASPSAGTGKSTVALGLVSSLTKVVAKVGVFRPFADSRDDPFLSLLLARSGSSASAADCIGVTWDEYHAGPEEALSRIVSSYRALARDHDVIIIYGSDYTDVAGSPELALNARVAANIGVPVLLVVAGKGSPEDVRTSIKVSVAEIANGHARTVAAVANKCPRTDNGTAGMGGTVSQCACIQPCCVLQQRQPALWRLPYFAPRAPKLPWFVHPFRRKRPQNMGRRHRVFRPTRRTISPFTPISVTRQVSF